MKKIWLGLWQWWKNKQSTSDSQLTQKDRNEIDLTVKIVGEILEAPKGLTLSVVPMEGQHKNTHD